MASSPLRLTSEWEAASEDDTPRLALPDDSIFARPAPQQNRNLMTADSLLSTNIAVNETFIWGTTVNLKSTYDQLVQFIVNAEGGRYVQVLRQLRSQRQTSLQLDCTDIYNNNPSLYRNLCSYPQEVLPIFDTAVTDTARQILEADRENGDVDGTEDADAEYQVHPFRLQSTESRSLRGLNPSDLDMLVAVRGMVVRSSVIVPDLREGFFRCTICAHECAVSLELGRLNEPTNCAHCRAKGSYQIIHNRCLYADKQFIKLQETVEAIPEGETPHTVTLCVYDSLVDVARPGDQVVVTGIFRAHPVRISATQRTLKQIYKTYIDCLHFSRIGASRNSDEVSAATEDTVASGSEFSRPHENVPYMESHELHDDAIERERRMRILGERPDIYDHLVNSFAPSIWALEDVKKGLLCMLFGGTSKKLKAVSFRSDINVLLCGDPGTSKSQLLQYVHKLASRGIYTSGKGSSAVGLTAYVTKDPDTGEAVLESGALVLSDQGVCCIDEFDKMDDLTRSILHEAMEQQTVSVAKAGIIASLNARASVLASANPRESRYNPSLSVVDNIQLPPTLLSRFDLIYLILDKPDPATDRKLASHLVGLYFQNHERESDQGIPHKELREYIEFAKANCAPRLSDAAGRLLIRGYVGMRQAGNAGSGKRTVSATPRQLESCIRICEALARMELSAEVEERHVEEALRLMRAAMQSAATDPRTGLIDMDLIATGRSATYQSNLRDLVTAIRAALQSRSTAVVSVNELISEFPTAQRHEFDEALHMLAEEEAVIITGPPKNRMVRRMYD